MTGLFRGLIMSCGREGVFTAGYMGLGPSVAKVECEMMGNLCIARAFEASSMTAFNPCCYPHVGVRGSA